MNEPVHSEWVQIVTFFLVLIAVGIALANRNLASPTLAIAGRWTRWIAIAWIGGGFAYQTFATEYGLWTLIFVSFVGWFLVESIYTYIAINALNRSGLPLFPHYEANTKGDEWPSQKRFIQLKDWIRQNGFSKRDALIGYLGEQSIMRISAYDAEDAKTRLHVLFVPHYRGSVGVCFSFTSMTESGLRLVTDNIFFPFGGFYPENWYVERKPWSRSTESLKSRHFARIDARGETLVEIEEEPMDLLRRDQNKIEQINRELGFLNPTVREEESGRLTSAGRYRIWQEIWLLNYFGKPLRYL